MNVAKLRKPPNPVVGIGDWSIRHPWPSIACWLGFVAVAVAAGVVTGSKDLQTGAVGESARGYTMLEQFKIRPAQFDYGYLHSDRLHAGDPAFTAAIADAKTRMRAVLHTSVSVRTSADGHSVLLASPATKQFAGRLQLSLQAAARAHPQVVIGGDGPGGVGTTSNDDLHRAELLAVPVTLLVLLFAFGALAAAVIPVVLALTAVIAAFGLLGPISHLTPLDSSVQTVVLLIGMAVGVDYALFYVIRSRQERLRGVQHDRSPGAHRPQLRAHGCRGGDDRGHGHGRAVRDRRVHFQRARERHHRRGRLRRCRIGDRPAGPARPARASHRPWPRPVPAAPPHRQQHVSVLAGRGRPGAAPARDLPGGPPAC